MSEKKILLNENSNIECEFSIESSSPINNKKIKARLVCEDKDFSYCFPGQVEKNSIIVHIPPMDTFLKEGCYKSKLEVIIGENYFEVLNLDLNFVKPYKIKAKLKEGQTEPRKDNISLKIDKIKIKSLRERIKK